MVNRVLRNQTLVGKVGELMDGTPPFDIMSVFAWIMGDMIIQAKANPEAVTTAFTTMVKLAVDFQNATLKGAPPGTMMQ